MKIFSFYRKPFSKGPLERHFAEHRRRGGCSDNKTLDQFQDQVVHLNVMKSGLVNNLRGNTSGIAARNPAIDDAKN